MKYVYTEKDLDLISWDRIDQFIDKIYADVKNHVTGTTANIAVDLLREKFGKDIKIIYVSLTRDYTYKDSVKNVCYTTWGMTTNETRNLSKEECDNLGISYNLVSSYPWENVEEELRELNDYTEFLEDKKL